MNNIIQPYFIILVLIFSGCTQIKEENSSVITNSVEQEIETDTALNDNDNALIDTSQFQINDLSKLKKLVIDEYNRIESFNEKSVDSLIIANPDSIRKFNYLVNMFPLEKIDSIEFYGIINKQKVSPLHLRMNSLLIIYFNDFQTSKNEFDSLEINYRKNFRATESMFKPGGISFEIDNQLAVYSVNTCGPGYKNLQRIDTLINETVFKKNSFTRLHSGCGMGPFKRIEK